MACREKKEDLQGNLILSPSGPWHYLDKVLSYLTVEYFLIKC